jgi:hypothetical protein
MSNSGVPLIIWTVIAAAAATPVAAQQATNLPARDNALRDQPANVFAVGTVEGEDWEMFSGIRSVAFDATDNLYLLDGQNHRVVVFDANGRFVRQFGKQGGGPGEFQAPLAMDVASNGNIVVSDLGNRAFVVFTGDGEYVRNIPFDEGSGFPLAMSADRQGGVITRSMRGIRPDQPVADGANFSPINRHSLAAENGAAAATLYRVPVAAPRVLDSGSTGAARRTAFISMDPVFGPRISFGALPTGLAVHHETGYAVRILDTAGRQVRTITRDIEPRKVTKKDQEEWHEQRRQDQANGRGPQIVMSRTTSPGSTGSVSIGRGGQGQGQPMQMSLDDVPFAEFMSVVTEIRTDPQGRIWVQRRNRDGTSAGPIDLVMADGRYIGTLPAQPLPGAVSRSGLAAWVTTDDDLGVERVEVRRLPGSWR